MSVAGVCVVGHLQDDNKMLYNKFKRLRTDMLYNIYNLLWACPLVVLYMSAAGVRVVEFGTYQS